MNNQIKCEKLGDWPGSVYIDGVRLSPAPSQALRNHSPDGFSWGYGGSGPAQLALAILLHVSGDAERSSRLYQNFKDEFVAVWPDASHVAVVDVASWMDAAEAGVS